ncbi:MAG: DNA-directed RNA polymerase subunit omega [Actinomyces sp.]|uniref:DNA-directed RNA polymerase subunit omega n=1 Tax=Actinomyces polynesiensis TaxID=1325934 RepID=UPI0005BCDA37|nr:DNA-directed RNA polymerase subunit omega [Actinomyces polynesiensis]MDN5964537.1 DNA-directed RNA polymerase subunit omega [Actinomyces sp.]MDN6428414.1 DNA-directed RNA polymerase subunit omega [Propionibacterium sp.]MDN6565463.1 DNA-directed RNA polymerase subunit omega [Actinomyces sp.]MDN6793477.1 DNA-directed RNA polymerase subunit omega [Propionibacterium sp.]
MSGIVAQPEGITYPPIDDLLEHVDSKYALVIFAAKRARQINAYNLQLEQNMVQFVGPVVETEPDEKPLAIALREIDEGLLTLEADQKA